MRPSPLFLLSPHILSVHLQVVLVLLVEWIVFFLLSLECLLLSQLDSHLLLFEEIQVNNLLLRRQVVPLDVTVLQHHSLLMQGYLSLVLKLFHQSQFLQLLLSVTQHVVLVAHSLIHHPILLPGRRFLNVGRQHLLSR